MSFLGSVAPVRERGLKLTFLTSIGRLLLSRSREGAWIEILVVKLLPP